ncbi:MAG: acyl-CoA thioesterase [Streptosporangiales bacterium]|jgi:acyl-CoA thioesterase FadM|nr:acyl-CoA thioesterase [Streptosporangiales bacterium]
MSAPAGPGPFVTHGTVTWSETDASGRYHFTAPLRWAEDAEHAFYRSAGTGTIVGGFPRRAVSVDYSRPLEAGDAYTVELSAEKAGRTSIGYRWRVLGPGGPCAEGRHTVVHVDESGRPAPLPDALRAALGTIAGDGTV